MALLALLAWIDVAEAPVAQGRIGLRDPDVELEHRFVRLAGQSCVRVLFLILEMLCSVALTYTLWMSPFYN